MQEVGGGAERAAHRAIIERDQAHRADFGQVRLARRLARQCSDAIRRLEALPIGRIRHLLVGSAVNRIAQLVAIQRTLRHRNDARRPRYVLRVPVMPRKGRPARMRATSSSSGRLALAENDQIEGTELEHQFRTKGRLHTAGDNQCSRGHAAHNVRELQIEPQGHAGGRDADDIPCAAEQARARVLAAAARSSSSGRTPSPRRLPTAERRQAARPPAAARGTCIRRSADRTGRSTRPGAHLH